MNKLIGLVFLLALSACSPSSQTKTELPNDTNIILLEAKDMAITGNLNMGDFLPTDSSKLVTYSLKNNGTEPLTGPVTLSDNTNFYLAYQNCASIAVKKTCSIKISFNPKGKSGNYSTTLSIDSLSTEITASVSTPQPPNVNVQLLVSSEDISINGLNFGTITDKQNIIKTISIKNTGDVALSGESVGISSSASPVPFLISYDSCSGKNLAKGSSCLVKVTLNGAGKSGSQTGQLTFAGKSSALSGQVEVSSSSGSGSGGSSVSLAYYAGATALGSAYDFGLFTSASQSKQLVLTVKNNGTLAFISGEVTLSSTDFSILYNTCNNKQLNTGASCQVRVTFSASSKVNNSYSGVLSLGGVDLNLSATVNVPTVVVTYEPLYSNYGSCKVGSLDILACDGEGMQSRNILSCRKMENGIDVGGATLGNCNAFQNDSYLKQPCLSPAGNKTLVIDNGSRIVSCLSGSSVQTPVSITCDNSSLASGFHSEDELSCTSNTRACSSLPQGVSSGNEIYTNSSWGSCIALTCISNYSLNGGVCEENQGGGVENGNISLRPKNITVPVGSKQIRFYASRGDGDFNNYTMNIIGLPGATVTSSEGPKNILGDMVKVFIVDLSSVPAGSNGSVQVLDSQNNLASSSISINGGIYGIGGVASNYGFSQITSSLNEKIKSIFNGEIFLPQRYLSGGGDGVGVVSFNDHGVVRLNTAITNWIQGQGYAAGDSITDAMGNIYVLMGGCSSPCSRTLSNYPSISYQDHNVKIGKFLPSGILDSTFGTNGVATLIEEGEDHANLAFNSSGTSLKILNNLLIATANSYRYSGTQPEGNRAMVFIYNMNGTPSSSFGNNGAKVFEFSPETINQYSSAPTSNQARDQYSLGVELDSQGKLLLIGSSPNKKVGFDILNTLVLVKFNFNGTIDSSFGTNGYIYDFLKPANEVSTLGSYYFHYSSYGDQLLIRYYTNAQTNIGYYTKYKKYSILTGSSLPAWPADMDIRDALDAHLGGGIHAATYSSFKGILLSDGSVVSIFNVWDNSGAILSPGLIKFLPNGTPDSSWNNGSAVVKLRGLKGKSLDGIYYDGTYLYAEMSAANISAVRQLYEPSGSNSEPNTYGYGAGVIRISATNAAQSLDTLDLQRNYTKVSMYCGPYGDLDENFNYCVCDSGYQTIDYSSGIFNNSEIDKWGYTCVKPGQDLCESNYTWNGTSCSSNSSCNNNMMCENWMGEDSMNCPMDCQPVMCSNIFDQFSCQTNNCMWNYNYNDCSMLVDQFSCQNNSNGICSWTPNTMDCSTAFSDESSCMNTSGCSWNYFDTMEPWMGGTCSGQYEDLNSGSCSGGSYQDMNSGYCM